MRLLVTLPYFYPRIGGQENYVYHICKELLSICNAEITVATFNHEKNDFLMEKFEGITVYRFPHLFKISATPISFSFFLKILKLSKECDMIYSHTPMPFVSEMSLIASKIRNLPFVLVLHGTVEEKDGLCLKLLTSLYNALLKRIVLPLTIRIICCSDVLTNSLKKKGFKAVTVTPGADKDFFEVSALYEQEGIKKIVFVGQINKENHGKGLGDLLIAFRNVLRSVDARLIVVGPGNAIDDYKKMSVELKISEKVTFTGPISSQNMPGIYKKAAVVVLPPRHSEGLGIILVEAGACGIPTIGTKVGGIPNVIQDGKTGLIVPPNNPERLAEGIMRIITDRELSERMGREGREYIRKNFDWRISAKKTCDIFRELLKNK